MICSSIKLFLLILMSLIAFSEAYLQFNLIRNEQKNTLAAKDQCISKNSIHPNDEQDYEQLCYFKDISYYIELFYTNKLYHISIDLTSPYSWLKGSQCKVVQTGQMCHLIQESQINQHKQIRHIKSNKQVQDEQKEKQPKGQQAQQNQILQKHARIQGSNQVVEGDLVTNKQLQFWTKDSGRLSRLLDILMLGFFILQQKQKVSLSKTNFINVTKLSSNMNSLCDGAFSLRFDEKSQNSLLQQIFQYTQTLQKIITIYINGHQSTLTIGQLSIKNSEDGYGGILWVPFGEEDEQTNYGRLPLASEVLLESLLKDRESYIQKDQDDSVFAVLSLSATYIGLPQKTMQSLIVGFKQIHGLECQINPHSFLECTNLPKKQQMLDQNLLISMKGQGSISISLESLVLKKSKKKLTLNLRLISQQKKQTKKSFIILGEPYFNKYFTILDYKQNRFGFGLKRTMSHNNFISTISLIRFVSLLFFSGCCFLICFHPLKKMIDTFRGNGAKYNRRTGEGRRLKYEPVEDNPYEETAGTLRKVLGQIEEGHFVNSNDHSTNHSTNSTDNQNHYINQANQNDSL